MLEYLYGKRFGSKIAWNNRKEGDRVGAGPDPFLRWGVVSTSPKPQAGGTPLSAARHCLFNIFAATLHTGGRSSIRNLRTLHVVVTGTQLPRYQVPRFDCCKI